MNEIRQILLHVDSTNEALDRLSACRVLADQFDAKVTALYAVTPWLLLYPVAYDAGGYVASTLSDWDKQRLRNTHERISRAIEGSPAIRWAQLESDTPFDFAKQALYSDLMVLGCRVKDGGPGKEDVPSDFLTHVIFHSGKPALILPPDCVAMPSAGTVLLAWSGTRESASAMTAALPFLKRAKAVHILHCQTDDADSGELSALASHLQSHDIQAILHLEPDAGMDAGAMLLKKAEELRADLIVMGCYGHSRAREWVLGGTTRTVLSNTTVPLLMAH